jgi:hypothetical protein
MTLAGRVLVLGVVAFAFSALAASPRSQPRHWLRKGYLRDQEALHILANQTSLSSGTIPAQPGKVAPSVVPEQAAQAT